ncbi:hypothetical protein AciM339_0246 [Aciduliprofundum sp. MAR08-339]|uniref:type II toxin-antitoxin system antitoxin SocA domain-containing protein n=1 Tax=Aciduliprofundum sp. (strain MAR08-339) TaxID=673860 RepID=UPI0002A48772|nr:hypothetical protein AciM339_0246 [Aciduliprofundum sp. MAR08-339]
MIEKDIIAYLLKECGGLHPFHLSRIIALLDMEYLKEKGKKLTTLDYQKSQYGIYSEKLPKLIEELPVEKVKAQPYGYLVLKEDVPLNLPDDVREKIEKVLDEVCDLSDSELNAKVLTSPYYEKL